MSARTIAERVIDVVRAEVRERGTTPTDVDVDAALDDLVRRATGLSSWTLAGSGDLTLVELDALAQAVGLSPVRLLARATREGEEP